jgi:hypothetical protein
VGVLAPEIQLELSYRSTGPIDFVEWSVLPANEVTP